MKLCAECRHLDSKFESPGGGCHTCGHGAGRGFVLKCSKGHFEEPPEGQHDFYRMLRTAQQCPDFEALTAAEIAKL